LGRICLLLGEKDEAKTYLSAAVSIKPTHSAARFCLGLALASTNEGHAKNLLLHGLSQYLQQVQELHEAKSDPFTSKPRELFSRQFYRKTKKK